MFFFIFFILFVGLESLEWLLFLETINFTTFEPLGSHLTIWRKSIYF